jgi:hypothetical protein
VLVSLNFPNLTDQTADLVMRFTRVALQTLVDLGASYELFDTSSPLRDPAQVTRCDGLILLGGGDVDGRLYGADHVDVPNSYGVDLQADHDGIAAVEAAVADHLPVFGICRGSQLINVARGGTIIPDIDDFGLHRGRPGEPMFLDEEINILPGRGWQDCSAATSWSADPVITRRWRTSARGSWSRLAHTTGSSKALRTRPGGWVASSGTPRTTMDRKPIASGFSTVSWRLARRGGPLGAPLWADVMRCATFMSTQGGPRLTVVRGHRRAETPAGSQ